MRVVEVLAGLKSTQVPGTFTNIYAYSIATHSNSKRAFWKRASRFLMQLKEHCMSNAVIAIHVIALFNSHGLHQWQNQG